MEDGVLASLYPPTGCTRLSSSVQSLQLCFLQQHRVTLMAPISLLPMKSSSPHHPYPVTLWQSTPLSIVLQPLRAPESLVPYSCLCWKAGKDHVPFKRNLVETLPVWDMSGCQNPWDKDWICEPMCLNMFKSVESRARSFTQ